ncbi:MAG: Ppx/GppA family phosphatase [Acidimicrobiia bacterium]|nr:Ppx/GppA family phosphatase [Acidimicrobiia bacterium]
MRVAVIDLGSNSFRLLVADVEPGGGIRPVLREREMLYLGGALAQSPVLSEEHIGMAVGATKRLHDLGVRTGADRTIAVATAAIRTAGNREEILARLSEAAGTPIRMLDGEEEARLGFIGVAASVALPAEPHGVIDLGGGSLEIAIGHAGTVEWSTSVPVGVSRFHAAHVHDDPMLPDAAQKIADEVRSLVAEAAVEAARRRPGATVAIGGSIRALTRVVAARTLGWTPGILNQFYITADEIRLTMEEMLPMTRTERLDVAGVKESRADQIATAALITNTIFEEFQLERLWVSYWGLREGAIIDEYGAHEFPLGTELRDTSVARMAARFVSDPTHSEHVAHLASSLFAQTRRLHGLSQSDREVMLYAARLHTIGMSVAFNGYARHGAYLLEHSELRGFSPNEIAFLASLVRFHRRGIPSSEYEPYANLTKASRSRVDALVALLHTADVLDRALDQSVHEIELRHEPGLIHVRFLGDDPRIRRDWATSAAGSIARALDVALVFDRDQLIET